MTKFLYSPTYEQKNGYASSLDSISLNYENLKNRLIDDVLNTEDNDMRLIAFDVEIDNVIVHGAKDPSWYFEYYVKSGAEEYRLGRSNEDILDFIHYFDKFANIDVIFSEQAEQI